MAYSTIIKKKCKSIGCEKYPVTGMNGFCLDHVPQLLKDRKVSNHVQSKRNRVILAFNRKKVHDAQREFSGADFFLKTAVRQKPLPQFSKKRLADLKIYTVLRRDFLIDHPICECGMPDCDKGKSVDVHHTFMGSDRNRHFTDVDSWKAVSRKDHRIIHDELSTEQMVEYGLRKFDN